MKILFIFVFTFISVNIFADVGFESDNTNELILESLKQINMTLDLMNAQTEAQIALIKRILETLEPVTIDMYGKVK